MLKNDNTQQSNWNTTVRQRHCPLTLHQEREWTLSWRRGVPVPEKNPSQTLSPTAPRVSTAMDVKSYNGDRLMYSDFFFSSASFATALGPTTALLRWLKASVSGQVKSHMTNTRELSAAHGTIVRPSGLSPSLRLSDAGSNMAGHLRWSQRSFDEVVDCVVSEVMTDRLMASQSMSHCYIDLLAALWSKSDSQLSKYCVVCEIRWCRCQQLTALSIIMASVTKLLVIEQLLHPAMKFAVSAPWHNFKFYLNCPSNKSWRRYWRRITSFEKASQIAAVQLGVIFLKFNELIINKIKIQLFKRKRAKTILVCLLNSWVHNRCCLCPTRSGLRTEVTLVAIKVSTMWRSWLKHLKSVNNREKFLF